MSLIKLFKIPAKLFMKDIITFLKIRRHDLAVIDDKLRYIAIKPTASVLQIRQRLWYLLDLPDYCDEILILKTEFGDEITLTDLKKGNDPQHPYILEVWPPGQTTISRVHNVISSENKSTTSNITTHSIEDKNSCETKLGNNATCDKFKSPVNNFLSEYKKSELSCKISTSTLFFRIHGKKSRDNFANLLLKIQSDLSTLSNKLSNLENRIQL